MIGKVRALVIVWLAVSSVGALGGCSLLKADEKKHMSVDFARTTAFYEKSKVKVMGVDVGTVDRVKIMGDRIRVEFSVGRDVPIPKDVHAAIVPLNLVGERNLVLSPVWKPGMAQAEDGTRIPQERTTLPVETDEALKAFTNVADALDPTKVRDALGKTADSFKGNGREFNSALQQSARLTAGLAGQDQELLQVARNLSTLAGTVRGREQTLGSVIRDFSTASKVLAAERRDLQELIAGLLQLTKQGDRILGKYQGQLPGDLAVLTRVALSLKGNSKQLTQFLQALPGVGDAYINAYDEERRALVLRVHTDYLPRIWIRGLTGGQVDLCPLPPPNSNCPWEGQ
jgi:phospholipid/cholesterol/gamma-HCH transport system substrate-binding protein